MSPEQGHSFEADDPKQKIQAMLGSVIDALGDEDYEFATDIAVGQSLISPVDVVEYIHLQGKKEEDPVTQRRLKDGVYSIIGKLHERDQEEVNSGDERSLSQDDANRINAVMQNMDLQAMEENEVLAEEPDVDNADSDQYIEPDYDWDNDVFSVDLSDYTEEEIEKAKNTVGFKAALETAQHGRWSKASYNLNEARELIEAHGGKYKTLQLLMLDEVIAQAAINVAQHGRWSKASDNLSEARKLIGEHASDSNSTDKPITLRMLLSLDKYVFNAATQTAQHGRWSKVSYNLSEARELIKNYTSSPERAQAMLDELGL